MSISSSTSEALKRWIGDKVACCVPGRDFISMMTSSVIRERREPELAPDCCISREELHLTQQVPHSSDREADTSLLESAQGHKQSRKHCAVSPSFEAQMRLHPWFPRLLGPLALADLISWLAASLCLCSSHVQRILLLASQTQDTQRGRPDQIAADSCSFFKASRNCLRHDFIGYLVWGSIREGF